MKLTNSPAVSEPICFVGSQLDRVTLTDVFQAFSFCFRCFVGKKLQYVEVLVSDLHAQM